MTDNNDIIYMQCFPVTVTPKREVTINDAISNRQQGVVIGSSTLQQASPPSDTMLMPNADSKQASQQQRVLPTVIPVQVTNIESYVKNTDAKVRMANSTKLSTTRNSPSMF